MTTDLPPDVRDRAARAAYDAINDVAWGQPGSDRHFKVAIVGWRAVVDAVAEVIGEELRKPREYDPDSNVSHRTAAKLLGKLDRAVAERDELRAARDRVLALCDERDQQTETRDPGHGPYRAVSTDAVRRRLVAPDTEEQNR